MPPVAPSVSSFISVVSVQLDKPFSIESASSATRRTRLRNCGRNQPIAAPRGRRRSAANIRARIHIPTIFQATRGMIYEDIFPIGLCMLYGHGLFAMLYHARAHEEPRPEEVSLKTGILEEIHFGPTPNRAAFLGVPSANCVGRRRSQ
jgi:hypothetical protein